MTVDPGKFLDDLTGRYAAPYFAAVHDLYVATVNGNRPAALDATNALHRVVRETMGAAEVLGASIMLRAAAPHIGRGRTLLRDERANLLRFRDEPTQTILPRVTLSEAIDDLVSRVPVTLHDAAERTALRISKLYGDGRVIAFARAAEHTVTQEAQAFIARALRQGISEGEAGRRLALTVNEIRQESAPWSESYARLAFRTNVNTAVTAGRFRQAQDPDIREVVPAFRFDAIGDSDTRDNHEAANGIILRVDNPAWSRIAPPLGFNCRCQVSHVSRFELESLGRIDVRGQVIEDRVPPNAFPDEGFRHGGRPDLMLGGVA